MKISSNFNQKYQKPNFKKGLTSAEINAVERMNKYEYADIAKSLKDRYGLEAEFGGCNTVAWCVEQITQIMTKAGFKLPKQFIFCPLNDILKDKPLGIFIKEEAAVYINADHREFTDLRAQNELEESQGNYHPTTKHFLHSYLHEFSHAAHFNNLCDRHGKDRAIELFNNELNNYSPEEFLVGPLNTLVKTKCPEFLHGAVDKIIPPTDGLYGLNNLKEYFAEKNSRYLAEMLEKNCNISGVTTNFASFYRQRPYDWSLKKELLNIFHKQTSLFGFQQKNFFEHMYERIREAYKLLQTDIDYLDADIYHGTINTNTKSYLPH